MSGGSDGGVPVRPIHVRTVAVAGLVVALTVAFGAGLYWVIPAMWALVCLGALVVAAVPTVFVSLARVDGAYGTGFDRAQAELVDAWATAYGLAPVPTDMPPVWVVGGVGAFLLVAQFAYTQRVATAVPGSDDKTTHAAVDPVVRRLAAQTDIPEPEVVVLEEAVPRCFAVGRVRSGAVVVTTGLVETLDEPQLEAALAHEVAHFANRDVTVMSILAFLPLLEDDSVPILDGLARSATHFVLYGRETLRAHSPGPALALVDLFEGALRGLAAAALQVYEWAVLAVLGLLVLDVAYLDFTVTEVVVALYVRSGLSPIWSGVVVLAALTVVLYEKDYPIPFLVPAWLLGRVVAVVFSRTAGPLVGRAARDREFAADRAAAELTGDPAALASALEALDPAVSVESTDLREHAGLVSLAIVPYDIGDSRSAWHRITEHPPTAERVDRLRELVAAQ